MAGKAMDPLGLLSDDSDASDDDEEATKQAEEAANAAKRKKVDFETLCAAGYKGCATTRIPTDALRSAKARLASPTTLYPADRPGWEPGFGAAQGAFGAAGTGDEQRAAIVGLVRPRLK
jgi:hypothetical protein